MKMPMRPTNTLRLRTTTAGSRRSLIFTKISQHFNWFGSTRAGAVPLLAPAFQPEQVAACFGAPDVYVLNVFVRKEPPRLFIFLAICQTPLFDQVPVVAIGLQG